jgi:hypothetical protein
MHFCFEAKEKAKAEVFLVLALALAFMRSEVYFVSLP